MHTVCFTVLTNRNPCFIRMHLESTWQVVNGLSPRVDMNRWSEIIKTLWFCTVWAEKQKAKQRHLEISYKTTGSQVALSPFSQRLHWADTTHSPPLPMSTTSSSCWEETAMSQRERRKTTWVSTLELYNRNFMRLPCGCQGLKTLRSFWVVSVPHGGFHNLSFKHKYLP